MATLPAPGSSVGVGPPLAARGPRRGSPAIFAPGHVGSPGSTTLASAPGAARRTRARSARIEAPIVAPDTEAPTAHTPVGPPPTALPLNVENVTDMVPGATAETAPPEPPATSGAL